MQPDVFISKRFGNFRATAVMDVEVGNRGAMAIREYGMRLFNAPGSEVQVFVAIKLNLRRASHDATNPRYFQLNQPSAAMMWERNALEIVVCTSAIDFGVSPVSPQSLTAFARVRAGCLQGIGNVQVLPHPAMALLAVPAHVIWRGVVDVNEAPVLLPAGVGDCQLDLRRMFVNSLTNCTSMVNGNLTHF
jgi:hypothetical protein